MVISAEEPSPNPGPDWEDWLVLSAGVQSSVLTHILGHNDEQTQPTISGLVRTCRRLNTCVTAAIARLSPEGPVCKLDILLSATGMCWFEANLDWLHVHKATRRFGVLEIRFRGLDNCMTIDRSAAEGLAAVLVQKTLPAVLKRFMERGPLAQSAKLPPGQLFRAAVVILDLTCRPRVGDMVSKVFAKHATRSLYQTLKPKHPESLGWYGQSHFGKIVVKSNAGTKTIDIGKMLARYGVQKNRGFVKDYTKLAWKYSSIKIRRDRGWDVGTSIEWPKVSNQLERLCEKLQMGNLPR